MKLSKLLIYPIKSCHSFELNSEWPLCETGLKYDRKWMIIDRFSRFVSQRKLPKLCFIKPIVNLNTKMLHISYDDIEESKITVPLELEVLPKTALIEAEIHRKITQAVDCGEAIALWLEEYIGIPGLRLVRHDRDQQRKKDVKITFTDKAQFLLINEATVNWFAEKLKDYSYINLSSENLMRRFRGNFVISGHLEALAEYSWSEVSIGSARFKVTEPCTRCNVICVNQLTAEVNKEILSTLSSVANGKAVFGIYMKIISDHESDENTILKLGDTVISKIKEEKE